MADGWHLGMRICVHHDSYGFRQLSSKAGDNGRSASVQNLASGLSRPAARPCQAQPLPGGKQTQNCKFNTAKTSARGILTDPSCVGSLAKPAEHPPPGTGQPVKDCLPIAMYTLQLADSSSLSKACKSHHAIHTVCGHTLAVTEWRSEAAARQQLMCSVVLLHCVQGTCCSPCCNVGSQQAGTTAGAVGRWCKESIQQSVVEGNRLYLKTQASQTASLTAIKTVFQGTPNTPSRSTFISCGSWCITGSVVAIATKSTAGLTKTVISITQHHCGSALDTSCTCRILYKRACTPGDTQITKVATAKKQQCGLLTHTQPGPHPTHNTNQPTGIQPPA